MKIKDLKEDYPLVYEAALRNQVAAGNKRNDGADLGHDGNQGGFCWQSSPEGRAFWADICGGYFEEAKSECPHLFIQQGPSHTIEVLPPGTCVFMLELAGECDARIGTGTVKGATIDEAGGVSYLVKQQSSGRYVEANEVYADFDAFCEKVNEVCREYKAIELQQKKEK